MSSVVSEDAAAKPARQASRRANALADRLEQGARLLADLAGTLTGAEWHTRVPKDGRKIGVVVLKR